MDAIARSMERGDNMTNEEAIKLIDDRMCFGRGKWSEHHRPVIDEYWQAGEMAIKALEAEPLQVARDIATIIENEQDMRILPKRGKWILDRSGAYCCSECMEPCATYVMMRPRDKFCKMCGAKMEVTE